MLFRTQLISKGSSAHLKRLNHPGTDKKKALGTARLRGLSVSGGRANPPPGSGLGYAERLAHIRDLGITTVALAVGLHPVRAPVLSGRLPRCPLLLAPPLLRLRLRPLAVTRREAVGEDGGAASSSHGGRPSSVASWKISAQGPRIAAAGLTEASAPSPTSSERAAVTRCRASFSRFSSAAQRGPLPDLHSALASALVSAFSALSRARCAPCLGRFEDLAACALASVVWETRSRTTDPEMTAATSPRMPSTPKWT
jgi:hypothetical protein